MYPELVTRGDLEVFLPPIGGQTVYVFGNPHDLAESGGHADGARARRVQRLRRVRLRHLHLPPVSHARDRGVHPRRAGRRRRPRRLLPQGGPRARRGDEVPRLQRAQAAGGRRLAPTKYFLRTECVAGVQDMRFQELMPDVLHWLGITQHPPPGVDEQHEVRRDRRLGHRGRRAREDSRRARSPPTRASRWTRRWPPATSRDGEVPDADEPRADARAASAVTGGGRATRPRRRRCARPPRRSASAARNMLPRP